MSHSDRELTQLLEQVSAHFSDSRAYLLQDLSDFGTKINLYPEMYLQVIFGCFHLRLTEQTEDSMTFMQNLVSFLHHFGVLPRKFTQPTLDMEGLEELLHQYASNQFYKDSEFALEVSVPDSIVKQIVSMKCKMEELVDGLTNLQVENVRLYLNTQAPMAKRLYSLTLFAYFDVQIDYLECIYYPKVNTIIYSEIMELIQDYMETNPNIYATRVWRLGIRHENFRLATRYPNINSIDTPLFDYLDILGLWDSNTNLQGIVQGVSRERRALPMPVHTNVLGGLEQIAKDYLYSTGILPPLDDLQDDFLFGKMMDIVIERAKSRLENPELDRKQESPDPIELAIIILWALIIPRAPVPLWRVPQHRSADG